MPLKVYETIGILNRYVSAVIDGKHVGISFQNGTTAPRAIQGSYTTKDKRIQKFLETSGDFNHKWKLVKTVPTTSDKEGVNEPESHDDDLARVNQKANPVIEEHDDLAVGQEQGIIDTPDPPHPIVKKAEPQITVVGEEVTSGQKAKNYLLEMFPEELTMRKLQSVPLIIAEAKARNIQFTHWEAFVNDKGAD